MALGEVGLSFHFIIYLFTGMPLILQQSKKVSGLGHIEANKNQKKIHSKKGNLLFGALVKTHCRFLVPGNTQKILTEI